MLQFLLTGCGAGYGYYVLGQAHVFMVDIYIYIDVAKSLWTWSNNPIPGFNV
jgi:hypothetical protein